MRVLKDNLRVMPTSVAGLALGVCGLGITWQTAAEYLLAAQWIKVSADVISLLSFNLGVTLLLLYGVKMGVSPRRCWEDVNAVRGATDLACLPMAVMMIAWWLHVHGYSPLAFSLWQGALGAQGVLLVCFLRHVRPFTWTKVTPGWLTPGVAAAMAAGTGAALGAGDWVGGLFWASFASFVVVFPLVLYRVHVYPSFLGDEEQAEYPGIAAPPAVLLIAWIALGGHQGHALTHFLFLVLMTSIVLVSLRLPFLATLPFTPAAAAAAFPADVAAKSAVLYTHLYQARNTVMFLCTWFFVLVATAVVLLLCTRFFLLLLSRLDAPAAAGEEDGKTRSGTEANGVRSYSTPHTYSTPPIEQRVPVEDAVL
eukprot:Tamp_12829.p1 GENE.Tamp_12829~~Tamp_12829.p1  ORF type:complete len:397 (-),score=50.83 Tamp_12829:585-1685(-)